MGHPFWQGGRTLGRQDGRRARLADRDFLRKRGLNTAMSLGFHGKGAIVVRPI
jgi:hypothetical protein